MKKIFMIFLLGCLIFAGAAFAAGPGVDEMIEIRRWRTATRTLDGKLWTLNEHRGKIVLLFFWSAYERDCREYEELLKKLYAKNASRDDFELFGISLDNKKEVVEDYLEMREIEWPQLHEPFKGWKNNFVRAFQVARVPALWLIDRKGGMYELDGRAIIGRVTAELFGMHFDSEDYIKNVIQRSLISGAPGTEEIEELCGRPDSVDENDNGFAWRYKRKNEQETVLLSVKISFNEAGRCVDYTSFERILDPALVRFRVDKDYWLAELAERVEQYTSSEQKSYSLTVRAVSDNYSRDLTDPLRQDFMAGTLYTRSLVPGKYDFYLIVYDLAGKDALREIKLLEGIELEKNSTQTIDVNAQNVWKEKLI